jgi:hypothetical protein
MTVFCEEVYRCNTRPLHLVIEEADEFAPMTGARRRALHHVLDELESALGFQVDGDGFLVGVERQEIPRVLVRGLARAGLIPCALRTGNPGLRRFKRYVVATLGNPFCGPAINA